MLDGSPAHSGETNIGNVENNNPITGSDGLNTGNKAKQAILKKGGKKLRHKPPRNSVNIRLTDNNNNSVTASTAAQPGTEPPAGTEPALSLHHLKQGARKEAGKCRLLVVGRFDCNIKEEDNELLKSKGGRLERGVVLSGGQPARNLVGHDQITRNVNVQSHKQAQSVGASLAMKRKDNSSPNKPPSLHQPALREQKKPLHASNNVKILNALPAGPAPEYLKDGEKVYAGAKFSEPPSPSVLPKPPSHWVGENEPQRSSQSREQMTVHLKSLLKVQDKA